MKRHTLALIAHDAKNEDMTLLVKVHREELSKAELIATRDTGQLVQGRTGLPVTLMQNEVCGGHQQIGALDLESGYTQLCWDW